MELQSQTISTQWIENLAIEEINMEESGIISFNDHLNPSYQLEESSIQFMNSLRDIMTLFVEKFNNHRNSQSSNIKIFKIANTINDFMVYRNSLRLIFARRSDDLISIGFLANGKDVFSARTTEEKDSSKQEITHEINAHIGPFNNISWTFNNEKVDINALSKHYLAEFIKLSAR